MLLVGQIAVAVPALRLLGQISQAEDTGLEFGFFLTLFVKNLRVTALAIDALVVRTFFFPTCYLRAYESHRGFMRLVFVVILKDDRGAAQHRPN